MRMSAETLFDHWIDPDSIWSPWAKPVLFASTDGADLARMRRHGIPPSNMAKHVPGATEKTAILLELAGEKTVDIAAVLATQGYQPVPLFNAVPAPSGTRAVHDLKRLFNRLAAYADDLAEIRIDSHAPPVFMLDRRRMTAARRGPAPGTFDNRWMVFPQDFPSGDFLQHHRVERVLLIDERGKSLADDLRHVLFRWQRSGLDIQQLAVGSDQRSRPLRVQRPFGLGWFWRRALAAARLRRNAAGGFGSIVPSPSEGSGYVG